MARTSSSPLLGSVALPKAASSSNRALMAGPRIGSGLQPVAGLARREDMARGLQVVLQLAAQLGAVRVHGARQHGGAVAPDLRQELDPRRDGAAAADQSDEQLVFLGSQRHRRAVAQHGARGAVHFDVAEALD